MHIVINTSDIKDTERRLIEAIAKGEWADYSSEDPALNDSADGATWGEDRTVRAHVIVAICAQLEPSLTVHAKGIRIRGAKITGQLDFQNLNLLFKLSLINCWVETEILLQDAQTRTIVLSGSRVCGIVANRISTIGGLYFDKGFICSGSIQLIDAQVTASIVADGAVFDRPHWLAFDGARLRLGGSLFLRNGFHCRGEIRLVDAEIGGSLVFENARLVNPSGMTLNASRVSTKKNVFLRSNFSSVGEIMLVNAQVGGSFLCQKATLENIYRIVLRADGMSVKGTMHLSDGFTAKGGVRLPFSNIGGTLECHNATFENIGRECLTANEITTGGSVFLRPNLETSGRVVFEGASIGGSLVCSNATLMSPRSVAFDATRVSVRHYLSFGPNFSAEGLVRLVGAEVGGSLEINKVDITNQGDIALKAGHLVTKGNITLFGRFIGEVHLQRVKTEGSLYANNSEFDGHRKVSIDADGLVTAGDVAMQHIRTSGELRLRNADIGGDLSLSCAALIGGVSGRAVRASGLKAKGSVYFDNGFRTVEGGVGLSRARIGGKLDCNNVILSSEDGNAFNAPGMEVQGTFIWQKFLARPQGVVNLAGTRVGQLNDDIQSWPEQNHLIIDGFKYNTFDTPIVDTRKRLEWLRLQKGFGPYAYEQAAQVLRSMGREREARKIAKAKQDDLRRLGTLNPFGWLWNWLLGFTIGHGYQVWRALLISIVVITIGIGVFEWSFQSQVMVLVKDRDKQTYIRGTRCPPDVPCFEPVIYSIDTFLPIVDLRQDSYWLPVGRESNFKFFKIYLWLHIFLGWMLTTIGVVGLTGIVRRE